MRVLIVNDLYTRSSAAGVAVFTAEALASLGAEVLFLASVQRAEEARAFEEGGMRISLVHLPPYAMRWRGYRALWNPRAIRTLEETAANFKPEVIHFHNVHTYFSYAALKGAARRGVPVVHTIHDVMPFCYQKMFCFLDERLTPEEPVDYGARFFRCLSCTRLRFNPVRNRVIRSLIQRHVDRVVAVSTPMREALEQNRIPVHQVIYNGIDCQAWKPPEDGGDGLRQAFGLAEARVAFYGGRLAYLKGGLHTVEALARIKSTVSNAKLLIPGEGGGFESEMRVLATRLGVGDDLVFTGWLRDEKLKAAYGAAHVVVSPSLCFESFNLINLEGMALGKPVISSFFGGPSEVVQEGITGYLINPLNVDLLADRMECLLKEEALALRMGRAGRDRVEQVFDLKKTAEDTLTLYEDLVSGVR
jgi:glycosyltransferase involved in cell wall biosynthesis